MLRHFQTFFVCFRWFPDNYTSTNFASRSSFQYNLCFRHFFQWHCGVRQLFHIPIPGPLLVICSTWTARGLKLTFTKMISPASTNCFKHHCRNYNLDLYVFMIHARRQSQFLFFSLQSMQFIVQEAHLFNFERITK